MDKISIHTPAKGVTEAVFLGQRIFGNFNPHSREGSDFENPQTRKMAKISIHTPAKGVTDPEGYQIYGLGISIHTPAKGVTGRISTFFPRNTYFNPHSREGSDFLPT